MFGRGRSRVSVAFLVAGSVWFVMASFEPQPGVGSWILEIAADDWSLDLNGTGYQVGKDPSGYEGYAVWRRNPPDNPRLTEEEVTDRVLRYASDGTWILFQRRFDWIWIDSRSGELHEAEDKESVQRDAPHDVGLLLDAMVEPRQSRKYLFAVLGGLCVTFALFRMFVSGRRRKPAKEIKHEAIPLSGGG